MEPPRKLLIEMTGGPDGSTLASMLGESIDGIVINNSRANNILSIQGIDETASEDIAFFLGYSFAEDMIRQGQQSIIISHCTTNSFLWHKGLELAEKYGYEYWSVDCRLPKIDPLDDQNCSVCGALPHHQRGSVIADAGRDTFFRKDGFSKLPGVTRKSLSGPAKCIMMNSTRNLEECRDVLLNLIATRKSRQIRNYAAFRLRGDGDVDEEEQASMTELGLRVPVNRMGQGT